MARNPNALVLILLVAATSMFDGSAAQTRHVVGDAMGWTIPSDGAMTYLNWAANKTFTVGDTLVFNYASGLHDVAKVTKEAFDACNGDSPIVTITNSPASVMLNETREQHYICTFGSHCLFGQKLSINVTRASTYPAPSPETSTSPPPREVQPPSTATPPSPSPSSMSPIGTVNPPPQNSAAACVGAAGFYATLLSIAIAFLY